MWVLPAAAGWAAGREGRVGAKGFRVLSAGAAGADAAATAMRNRNGTCFSDLQRSVTRREHSSPVRYPPVTRPFGL